MEVGGGGIVAPDFDLSEMQPSKLAELIANGDWYQVGFTIGEKLNEALENIPWDKIQKTGREIGRNVALFINGGIDGTDWKLVGSTIGNALNTAIYTAQEFVHTLNWKGIGTAIADMCSSAIKTTDFAAAADTLSTGLKGMLDLAAQFIGDFDWKELGYKIAEFIANIDLGDIVDSLVTLLTNAFVGAVNLLAGIGDLIAEKVAEDIENTDWSDTGDAFWHSIGQGIKVTFAPHQWLLDYVIIPMAAALTRAFGFDLPSNSELRDTVHGFGEDIMEGLKNGLLKPWVDGYNWLKQNIFDPICNWFCDLFDIHSPSKVFEGFGEDIMAGLIKGIENLKEGVRTKWEDIKNKASDTWENIKIKLRTKWNEIKENSTTKWNEIKSNLNTTWENIKTTASTKFGNIKTNLDTTGNNIKNNMSTTWNSVRDSFSRTWENMRNDSGIQGVKNTITSAFNSLGNNASTWGSDMIDGFKRGIENAKWKIANAASNIAQTVKSYLHFSRPDMGPLRDYETWMPDMVKGLTETLEKSSPELVKTTDKLAEKMSSSFKFNGASMPKMNLGSIINIPTRSAYGNIGKDIVEANRLSEQDIAKLGQEIGKNVVVNLTNMTTLSGRLINKEVKQVNAEHDFAFNT